MEIQISKNLEAGVQNFFFSVKPFRVYNLLKYIYIKNILSNHNSLVFREGSEIDSQFSKLLPFFKYISFDFPYQFVVLNIFCLRDIMKNVPQHIIYITLIMKSQILKLKVSLEIQKHISRTEYRLVLNIYINYIPLLFFEKKNHFQAEETFKSFWKPCVLPRLWLLWASCKTYWNTCL